MANTNQDVINTLKVLFDPHDYNKTYDRLNIVSYNFDGRIDFYQAIRTVPRKIAINNENYWKKLTVGSSSGTPTPTPSDEPDYLCFTANNAGATLRLFGVVDPEYTGELLDIEYSTDKKTWTTWEIEAVVGGEAATTSVLTFTNVGDKVYLRGNNINGTTYSKDDFDGYYYSFVFLGADDTHAEDNSFAVSGDLQTLVDKTGQDKEHGCFGFDDLGLFMNDETLSSNEAGITITTAPDLTATKIINFKYVNLFAGQTALTQPARMPALTTADLPQIDMNNPMLSYSFAYMYQGCTSLQQPVDFSHLTINSMEDVMSVMMALSAIYIYTNFNITDDGGATLNGLEGLTFPTTVEYAGETQTVDSFMFAQQLGNVNGFPPQERLTELFVGYATNGDDSTSTGYTSIEFDNDSVVKQGATLIATPLTATPLNPFDYGVNVNYRKIDTAAYDGTVQARLICTPNNNCEFVRWEQYSNGSWNTIGSSATITITITDSVEKHYYRAVAIPAPQYFRLAALEDNCSVSMYSSFSPIQNMEYSTDNGQTWNAFVNNGSYATINLNNGDYALFRGINTSLNYSQFVMNGKIAASGNVNTLFNKSDEDVTPISMHGLFSTDFGGDGVYDVSGLIFPSSPIYGPNDSNFAYGNMFAGSPCTMSQDGTHFIFSFPTTLPISTNPGTEYEKVYSDELDIAIEMGNVKGFQNVATIQNVYTPGVSYNRSVNGRYSNIAKRGDTIAFHPSIISTVSSYMTFDKWQVSTDNETWQDIPGATTIDCSFVNTYSGDIWLKAVFTYSNLFVTISYNPTITYNNVPKININLNGNIVKTLSPWNYYICLYNQGDVLTFSPANTTIDGTTYNLTINNTIGDTITLNSAEPFSIDINYKN